MQEARPGDEFRRVGLLGGQKAVDHQGNQIPDQGTGGVPYQVIHIKKAVGAPYKTESPCALGCFNEERDQESDRQGQSQPPSADPAHNEAQREEEDHIQQDLEEGHTPACAQIRHELQRVELGMQVVGGTERLPVVRHRPECEEDQGKEIEDDQVGRQGRNQA